MGRQFLTNLLVGMGRYWRGEALSAHSFIKGGAVSHLLTLLNRHMPSERGALADNLAPRAALSRCTRNWGEGWAR